MAARGDRVDIFAQKIVEGESQADAYRAAYPSSLKWQDKTVHNNASKFMATDEVSTRVKELQEEHKEKHCITVDTLLNELEVNRQAALTADTPQSAAATGATMGKAKLLGLDKQIIEHTSPDGSMSPDGLTSDERQSRIQALLSRQK